MLVRVQGTATKINLKDYKLELNIPALYFNDANHNLSLRMICFDLSLIADDTDERQFWSLSTSCVDKTAINPKQEIASFPTMITLGSGYDCIVYYEPSIKREYKIQSTSFHTSEFILTSLRPHENLEVGNIEILFEFTRYARI